MEGEFVGLPRAWRAALGEVERVGARSGIMAGSDRYPWCSGLFVPALELAQIDARGIGHRGDEVFGTHRLPVVALKI